MGIKKKKKKNQSHKTNQSSTSIMSVAGIDFGSKSNVVALARRKGIDVVVNEESKRETPSLINFGDKQRFVGCAAGDKVNMQPTNTVACLKRLIGKKFSDPSVQEDIKEFLFPVKGDKKTDSIIVTVEDGEKKEEEGAAAAEEPEETKPKFKIEIKKKTKKTDVPIKVTHSGGLPDKVLEKCKQEEFDMALQDKVMEETKERKNAVEAYVYSMRSKLEEGGQLFDYVKEDTRTSFKELLNNTEDWLYEDGEDEVKGVYVNKFEELFFIGNLIEERYNEEHKRPGAIAALESACQMIKQTSKDEAHAHIDAEDLKKVQKECDDAANWLA